MTRRPPFRNRARSWFAAAWLLLAAGGCIPPVAFHDGLPAWPIEPDGIEWRFGYQRLSAFGADSFEFLGRRYATPDVSIGYLTPGVRWGIRRRRLTAELGVSSAVGVTDGFSALFGGTVGLGYSTPKLCFMFRPSLYVVDIYSDNLGSGADFALWGQASLLVGNGYHAHGLNLALGARASEYSAGPVAFFGCNLSPVELRAEGSYLMPVSIYASGNVLTAGLTVAAPTRP